MFIVKNAVKNIYRYKSKYIMFAVLYFVLILAASVCVNIYINMDKVTNNILREYAGVAKLNMVAFDMYDLPDRLMKNQYSELKNIDTIADIKFLKYNFNTDFIKEGVSKIEVIVNSLSYESVFILGYNTSLLYLLPDEFNLESGRMFENGDECVISNNYQSNIGDIITVKNNDGIFREFTVVGVQNLDETTDTDCIIIYTTLESTEYFDDFAPIESSGIRGYSVNSEKIEFIKMGYEALVYLDNPEMFISLRNDFINIEKYGYLFTLDPLFTNFRPLLNVTQTMQSAATGFTLIAVMIILCVTIISTVIMLNNRKYEIAVLRSVGMKKSRLIISYLIENLAFLWAITVVTLILAQFIAPVFTNNVFESIKDLVSADIFNSLTAIGNFDIILQNIATVFIGTTAVVMLSLIFAYINIVRFEPLKIFGKQY
jgi:ABC-type transport system, involved in lipoprotein release, permease component